MENNLNLRLAEILKVMQERIMTQTSYFGIPTLQSPIDAWIYQEIIFEVKPDVIIEIGNFNGGSTLSLAHILDNLNKGRVIGVDLYHATVPELVRNHPRITLITSDACAAFEQVKSLIKDTDTVLIIEDSSHEYENTLKLLKLYGPLVKPGSYFIIEDGICHHGLAVGPNPGPYEAIEKFTQENTDFSIDRSREGFLITWNPKGFLKRIK